MYSDNQEDCEKNVRTDLWSSMSMHQLSVQQELVLDKLALLASIPQTQTIIDITAALKMGYEDLCYLMNNRIVDQKQKVKM
jgi:hypothetical protein